MATYEIPLSPEAQNFSIELGGNDLQFSLVWNSVSGSWTLGIGANDTPILSGIPLVTGIDLLSPYPYLNFNGQLVIRNDIAPEAEATYENLGLTSKLYFITS